MKRVVLVAALLISCTAGSMIAQRRGGGPGPVNPFLGNDQAVREGESLYSQHCTTCHGAGGGGGEIGPAIVTSDRTALGVNDAQTFNTIKNGVPGTRMPPQRLTDEQIWKITTYIHALRGTAIDNSTPGTGMVAVFSTSALGIHALRSSRHAPFTISHSAETPWPVAYSGVSA